MTRMRLLLALLVALAVLLPPGVAWRLAPPKPGITEANCDRIKPGMRLEEVEAILGGPPGYYEAGQFDHKIRRSTEGGTCWVAMDDLTATSLKLVEVTFRPDGTVDHAEYTGPSGAEPFKWLRSWLP